MFIAAMVTSGAIAVGLERFAYRPLRKRNAPALIALISAIGASFVLSELMGLRDKLFAVVGLDRMLDAYVGRARNNAGLPEILTPKPVFPLFDYEVTNVDILVVVGAIVMMVVLDQFVQRSRLGRGIRAVAQDPEAAALMGVNRDRVIQVTFLVGGVMAGVAAALYMLRIGITRYDAGFLLGVKAFTAAVLGGIGNLRGALVGGFVLGLAENYGSAIVGTQWKDVVAFVLLVVILLFRPTGLLGESLGKGTGMSVFTTAVGPRQGSAEAGQDRPVGASSCVFLFVLPLLNIPIITTPDSDFGGVLFTVSTYVLVALGLNIVVGYAGLLDLGYVGFYAIGAYTVGVLGVGTRQGPVAAVRAGRGGRGADLRPHPRCSDAAGPRRLPRHRHARLRRDRPADAGQLRLARRGGRHHRGAPAAQRVAVRRPAARLVRRAAAWSTWTTRPRS